MSMGAQVYISIFSIWLGEAEDGKESAKEKLQSVSGIYVWERGENFGFEIERRRMEVKILGCGSLRYERKSRFRLGPCVWKNLNRFT